MESARAFASIQEGLLAGNGVSLAGVVRGRRGRDAARSGSRFRHRRLRTGGGGDRGRARRRPAQRLLRPGAHRAGAGRRGCSYPDDEDELEEYEPDYIAWAPYALCRGCSSGRCAGERPDPLRAILERKVRLQGDLQRLVKHAGRHKGAGLDALRAIPAEFV